MAVAPVQGMTKNRKNPRTLSHKSSEKDDSARSGPAKIIDAVLRPEPACPSCLFAQAVNQNPEQLCEVHAEQNRPYKSPLRTEPPRGPEQRRQDAWILN